MASLLGAASLVAIVIIAISNNGKATIRELQKTNDALKVENAYLEYQIGIREYQMRGFWIALEPFEANYLPNDPSAAIELGFVSLEDVAYKKFYFTNPAGSPPYYGTDIDGADIDGDGIADLLVGRHPAFLLDLPAYVLLSSRWGDAREVAVPSGQEIVLESEFTYRTQFGNDIDGDGRPEMVLDSRLILSGLADTSRPDNPIEVDGLASAAVSPVKIVDDVNADGFDDFIAWRDQQAVVLSSQDIVGAADMGMAFDRADPIAVLPVTYPPITAHVATRVGNEIDSDFHTVPDYDSDGRPEIIAVMPDGQRDVVTILFSSDNFGAKGAVEIEFNHVEDTRLVLMTPANIGDFDADGQDDFWLQDPYSHSLYLVTAARLQAIRQEGIERIYIDDLAVTTVSGLIPPYDDPTGLTGSNRIAADYDGDGIPDLTYAYQFLFEGRGGLFIIPGSEIRGRDYIESLDDFVVRLTSYEVPIAALAPISFIGHLDFTGDGHPDIALGADRDWQGGWGGGAVYIVDGITIRDLMESASSTSGTRTGGQ
jgi:hypothetical protein